MTERYNTDRDPARRKILFPSSQAKWRDALLSGEVVDLPFNDAQHRPLRARIVAIRKGGIVDMVEAHLELH